MNRWILNSVRDSALSQKKEYLKKHVTYSSRVVHDADSIKTFAPQSPALSNYCVLILALTTDVHKQYNTACPLLPATKI
jgi:hypothetical protein